MVLHTCWMQWWCQWFLLVRNYVNIKSLFVNRQSCQDDEMNPPPDETLMFYTLTCMSAWFSCISVGSVYKLVHVIYEFCCWDMHVILRVVYGSFFCDWKNSFHHSIILWSPFTCVFLCAGHWLSSVNVCAGFTWAYTYIHEQHQQHMAHVVRKRRLQCNQHITADYLQ